MKTFSNKLITEITPEIISATLAKPTRNSNFIKIKISKKIKLEESSVEKTMFYIEEFTEKQAFQKTLNSTELQKLLCENIALNFKHTYIETNDTKLTFLTNKKGKTTVLEDKINKENRICNEKTAK